MEVVRLRIEVEICVSHCLSTHMRKALLYIAIICIATIGVQAVEESSPEAPQDNEPSAAAPAVGRPSLCRRILWYIPNRLMDIFDCFRLRAKFGPGLSVGARVSDYASFYAGEHHAVYIGLPGPRRDRLIRPPIGMESLDGIVIAGVDATDDTPHGPEYGRSEVDIGAHVLIAGAEAGIDPFEIGDLLAGFLLMDPAGDDFPRSPAPPRMTSAISTQTWAKQTYIEKKPLAFDSISDRLNYLHGNVNARVGEPIRNVDELMAPTNEICITSRDVRLRLGTYFEATKDDSLAFAFKPCVDLEVAVPNIEKRLRLFIQNSFDDDLPGRTPTERRNSSLTIGVRRVMKSCAISTDAGVRLSLDKLAFARIAWQPRWYLRDLSIRPQQRLFYEIDEQWGSLSTLSVDRWLGAPEKSYIGSISSMKWTTRYEDFEWEQTLKYGYVNELIVECDQLTGYSRHDVADGADISFSVFGRNSEMETYRLAVGGRHPLYKRWIYWELEPALEWRRENDFETSYRITFGIDMLFWGPDYD